MPSLATIASHRCPPASTFDPTCAAKKGAGARQGLPVLARFDRDGDLDRCASLGERATEIRLVALAAGLRSGSPGG